MNCTDFENQLPRFLYRLLSEREQQRAAAHLESCETCSALARPLRTQLCAEVLEVLADYLEGTLPERERLSLEAHLRVCPACVAYLDSYKATITLGRESFADCSKRESDLPEDLVRAVLASQLRDRPS